MCALFEGERDMSLFRHLNKELINDIIDTEIYYYKLIIDQSKVNVYGEGKNKTYYNPVKIPTLIDRSDRDQQNEDFGADYVRTVSFAFLRDTLVDMNIFPELGDVIEWNTEQHIVDNVLQNQFFGGKNPDTWVGGIKHGYNTSLICETHVTRKSQLNLRDDYRFGTNKNNNDLPIGI